MYPCRPGAAGSHGFMSMLRHRNDEMSWSRASSVWLFVHLPPPLSRLGTYMVETRRMAHLTRNPPMEPPRVALIEARVKALYMPLSLGGRSTLISGSWASARARWGSARSPRAVRFNLPSLSAKTRCAFASQATHDVIDGGTWAV